jgi:hypothetical protein
MFFKYKYKAHDDPHTVIETIHKLCVPVEQNCHRKAVFYLDGKGLTEELWYIAFQIRYRLCT